jgi:thioredoxin
MKFFYLLLLASLPFTGQTPLHADDDQQNTQTEMDQGDGTVAYVSSNDFNEFTKSGVVIVDFFADWCGPCKKLKPIFSQLAQSYKGRAKFAKVNIDHSGSIAKKYKVTRIPTVILLKDGKEIKRHGPGSKQDFIYWIDDAL